VLACQTVFATNGPLARWLGLTYPGVKAQMWWGAFNNLWDARTGLSLAVGLGGADMGRLLEAAAELRRALPGLMTRIDSADLDAAAALSQLELTRQFDHPMSRARMLGAMEAVFDGHLTWADLWAALSAEAHSVSPLLEVVEDTGCLVIRCAS